MPGEKAVRPEDVVLPSDPESLAEVRHELRTHLNHIVGYGEMILEDLESTGWYRGRREIDEVLELATGLTENTTELVHALDLGDRSLCASLMNSQIQPVLVRIKRLVTQMSNQAESFVAGETQTDLKRVASASESFLEAIDRGLQPQTSSLDRNPLTGERPQKDGEVDPLEKSSAQLLAVDDNPANLRLLQRFCERRGHKVTAARNGEQALDLLQQHKFDLVILDVMLPGMNGFEILDQINSDDRLNVPVIILSSLDDRQAVITSIRRGAVDFLRKPFNGEVLEARIQAQLDLKGKGFRSAEPRNPHGLSAREIEVLAHVALGKSNREIGEDLFIAENTVVRHVANIFAKVGLNNRAEAGVYAVVNGLADMDKSPR